MGRVFPRNMMPSDIYKQKLYKEKNPKDIWIKEAKTIDNAISPQFGPNGIYKMTNEGDILTTGKEIIDNIELGAIADPIRKTVNDQYKQHKDSTASLSLLLSKSIRKAQDLQTNHGLTKQIITEGYQKAMKIALETVTKNKKSVKRADIAALDLIIEQSIKGTIADKKNIKSTLRDSILFLKKPKYEDILVQVKSSGEGAEVFVGLSLSYNRKYEDMPEKVTDAKITIVDKIEPRKTKYDLKIDIKDVSSYKKTSSFETDQLKKIVDNFEKIGVNAIFSKGKIDDRAASILRDYKITAFENINDHDIKLLQKTTNAKLKPMYDITRNDLGYIGVIDDSDSEECIGGVCRT